jgi:hypothetical protein
VSTLGRFAVALPTAPHAGSARAPLTLLRPSPVTQPPALPSALLRPRSYKANHRNLLLVEEHLKDPGRATMRDCCFLTSLFFFVVVLPLMLVLSLLGAIVVAILAAFGVIR